MTSQFSMPPRAQGRANLRVDVPQPSFPLSRGSGKGALGTLTSAPTLTAAQVAAGVVTMDCNGTARAVTLPTGAELDAYFSDAQIGDFFDVVFYNSHSENATLTNASSGATVAGVATFDSVSGPKLVRAVRTAAATWVFYLVGGAVA